MNPAETLSELVTEVRTLSRVTNEILSNFSRLEHIDELKARVRYLDAQLQQSQAEEKRLRTQLETPVFKGAHFQNETLCMLRDVFGENVVTDTSKTPDSADKMIFIPFTPGEKNGVKILIDDKSMAHATVQRAHLTKLQKDMRRQDAQLGILMYRHLPAKYSDNVADLFGQPEKGAEFNPSRVIACNPSGFHMAMTTLLVRNFDTQRRYSSIFHEERTAMEEYVECSNRLCGPFLMHCTPTADYVELSKRLERCGQVVSRLRSAHGLSSLEMVRVRKRCVEIECAQTASTPR
tara:strand:+ start:158 stop:1033 length:876 start_codon:yes stop_codon:yes gene_type:complete